MVKSYSSEIVALIRAALSLGSLAGVGCFGEVFLGVAGFTGGLFFCAFYLGDALLGVEMVSGGAFLAVETWKFSKVLTIGVTGTS